MKSKNNILNKKILTNQLKSNTNQNNINIQK